jgi:hypothetical protein
MQDTAHQGSPLEDPLEQASPRSRMRASLGWAPSRSRGYAYLEQAPPRSRARSPLEQGPPRSRARSPPPPRTGSAPLEGPLPPRTGSAPLEGPLRPRTGSASLEGAPHARACSCTRAFNALTSAGRRHHAPGARTPVPPHQLPRRELIPATVGGTVRRGRCQSRDAAPRAPVRPTRRALEGGPAAPSIRFSCDPAGLGGGARPVGRHPCHC